LRRKIFDIHRNKPTALTTDLLTRMPASTESRTISAATHQTSDDAAGWNERRL
jgi:hypothetical protein